MEHITTPPAVNTVWPKLHDAIHHAKFSSETSELCELLEGGANVGELAEVHMARGMTVLHTAANSSVEIIDLLMAHGAADLLEVECGPGEEGRYAGFTPLQMAATFGCYDVARRLIHHGANFDAFSAVALGDENQLRSAYAADKSVLHATDAYQSSLVHWAAKAGNFGIVELLFDTGAEVSKPNLFDETPLMTASSGFPKNQPMSDFLFKQGDKRVTPFVASALGYDKPLTMLLDKRPECAYVKDGFDLSPLHWAARNGRESTVEILLAHGADANATNKIACTPLWYAAYQAGNERIVQMLCEGGANVHTKNMWGKSILDYDCGEACAKVIQSFGS